ncbi:hypothetical protein [Nocardia sp. alder85J]|uniref:hypothetical protein n=1 Tax=Nocardia sp. alder85J TaxID=2862949 RepID=UPI001CD543AE|nr:hypothetical protein [Nocardia sp. alder85J]MCX4097526.1 hypothetical protein [Nocardia sp. alder85J]
MTPGSGRRLLDDTALECTSVVANNAMNRDRRLSGVNSYTRELGFDPYRQLATALRAAPDRPIGWIDAEYLGADDQAGPGYTGQPAVTSYYEW